MTKELETTLSDDNKTRDFTMGKVKLHAVKTDPYGFWHVEEDGKKLDHLGVFTNVDDLDAGIHKYITEKKVS